MMYVFFFLIFFSFFPFVFAIPEDIRAGSYSEG